MSERVAGITYRSEKGAPLSHDEIDGNVVALRDFFNTLASSFGVVTDWDGTLKAGTVGEDQLAEGAVTRGKLAANGVGHYLDESATENVLAINPSPAATAWVKGMVFWIRLPSDKTANSGAMQVSLNGLKAELLKTGPFGALIPVPGGTVAGDSVVVVACVRVAPSVQCALLVTEPKASEVVLDEVLNGSFENNLDGWTAVKNTRSGGGEPVVTLERQADVWHGSQAVKLACVAGPNQSWPSLLSSGVLYSVAEDELVALSWAMRFTGGPSDYVYVLIKVILYWFDQDRQPLLTTPFSELFRWRYGKGDWLAGAGQWVWSRFRGAALAPPGARYYKIELSAGRPETGWPVPATGRAGHNDAVVWFDDVRKTRLAWGVRLDFGPLGDTHDVQTLTIPDGVDVARITCVGGGGAGATWAVKDGGGGGAMAISVVQVPRRGQMTVRVAPASGRTQLGLWSEVAFGGTYGNPYIGPEVGWRVLAAGGIHATSENRSGFFGGLASDCIGHRTFSGMDSGYRYYNGAFSDLNQGGASAFNKYGGEAGKGGSQADIYDGVWPGGGGAKPTIDNQTGGLGAGGLVRVEYATPAELLIA